jgi:hypothetical protein
MTHIKDNLVLEPSASELTESELLALLTARVSELFDKEPDLLMSLLYRLDVEESKIHNAMRLGAPDPIPVGLAKLVLQRQKLRFQTKTSVQVDQLIDEEDRW